MDLLVIEEKSTGLAFFAISTTILDQKPNQAMTTVEGSSTDLESIVSNDNRPAPSGADRAVDPTDAGSVVGGGGGGGDGGGVQPLGGGDGGARSMSNGGRSMENEN